MLASRATAEPAGDPVLVVKFWLILSGIYIWEFVSTLDFEWSVFRRHRPYRWTIWIYSVSRLSGLAIVILLLVNFFDAPINCQAWVTSCWAFSALGGYCLSSILIMLRIFAIWDRSKVIMAISAAIWVINLGFQLEGIVKIRAEWVPATRICAITNIEICRNFYINLLVTDAILLSIMLAGLLRLRRGDGGSFYLSHLLWKQGVIWFIIATVAEFPQMLFLYLNVNDTLDFLFLLPSMATIIIAATRMYRSLIHSASLPDMIHHSEPDPFNLPNTKRLVPHTRDHSLVVNIPSNRLEHTAYDGKYPSSDARLTDKPHELSLDDGNVEGYGV